MPSPISRYTHRMLDRDKPDSAIDIVAADVTGDGTQDVVCGSWWYRHGDWARFDLPEDFEVAAAAGAVLVTGNLRHFPKHQRKGVPVVAPAELLDLLRETA